MKKELMTIFSSTMALTLNTSEIEASNSFLEEMKKECETNRIKIAEEVNLLKKTGKISDSTFSKINEELKKIEVIYRASERPIQMSKAPLMGNAMNNIFGSNTALCKASIGKIKKLMEPGEAKPESAKPGETKSESTKPANLTPEQKSAFAFFSLPPTASWEEVRREYERRMSEYKAALRDPNNSGMRDRAISMTIYEMKSPFAILKKKYEKK